MVIYLGKIRHFWECNILCYKCQYGSHANLSGGGSGGDYDNNDDDDDKNNSSVEL